MARPRIRTIKPELWDSDDVHSLTPHGRLLWLWLIGHADDEGRLKASAELLASRNDVPVGECRDALGTMSDRGMVVCYIAESSPAVALVNWHRHQKVERPTASTIPAPPNTNGVHFDESSRGFTEDSVKDREHSRSARGPGPGPGPGPGGDPGPGEGPDPTCAHAREPGLNGSADAEYGAFVDEINRATRRHYRGDAESQRLYVKRRQEGRTADELLAAARGVAESPHHMGLNDNEIPYNAPANVLRSRVLDQLVALGSGEIGRVRRATRSEQSAADIDAWAAADPGEAQA